MWTDISLWFWFAFPWWLMMLSFPICLLWKNIYSGPLPIFKLGCLVFLMTCCMSSFYTFDTNPLPVIIICKLLLPFSRQFFLFVDSFLQSTKDFQFDIAPFIFAFVSLAWEDISKKILLRLMSKRLLPLFSPRSFMVSGLTFKSLIYF